jgi:hypothetical protein
MAKDDTYANFLLALDRAADSVEVTDWEAQFVESNLDRFSFSPKQRASIDRLMEKYAEKIGFKG